MHFPSKDPLVSAHRVYRSAAVQIVERGLTAWDVVQEILLPGQLLLKFFKEKLEDTMGEFAATVAKDAAKAPLLTSLSDERYVRKAFERCGDIGTKFEYFLNTGNLASKSGLDISQVRNRGSYLLEGGSSQSLVSFD